MEKRPKDWARIGAIAFVIALIGLYFINSLDLVSGLDGSLKMVIFFVLIGVALYVAFRLLGETKVGVSWGNMVIYIAILIGIVYAIIQFNIFPEFSVTARSIASILSRT